MGHLLMIHGIGCDGSAWDRMKPMFEAAGWTCHAPSLFPDRRVKENPPANLSELGLADYIDAMSAEARRITAETGARPAVIGHSMGGLISQVLAERGDVSRAVFLTPAQTKDCAALGLPVVWTFFNVLLSQDRKKAQKVWKRGFSYGVLNCVPKARHDEIYAGALYDSGRVYGDIADGIEIDEAQVKIPTLTIAATQDRATLAKAVRKVAAKYARSPVPGDFIEYPDHAHWIVDEPGTEKVAADITAWLAR
ncbi:alpha/beta hydrolase [Hyphomonas sp. WL0036]|uniref:alpha/beta hydrolase n=1 Tax=Hyphomonas sediminis TaxID=2866160 RepID=UPI001C80B7E4|nr:alpha/beta hydrolase [Hyphomonas sediminis]MBY9066358.1 alpha/beta hydrolase [Hyphomonas sediminis]